MTTDWSLYLVTDPDLANIDVPTIVTEAVRGGTTVVQLRDKHCSAEQFRSQAVQLREALKSAGIQVPIFLNDRAEIAAELSMHLHIGQDDMPYPQARKLLPPECMIGLSISNETELDQVLELDIPLPNVIGIGPVRPTPTKPDAAPALGIAGVDRIARRAHDHGIAAVAIGGIDHNLTRHLAHTSVDGVCVVSAIMASAQPATAAAQLRAAWR